MIKRISVVCLAAVLIVLMTGAFTYAMDMKGKIGFGAYGGYILLNATGFNQTLSEEKDRYEGGWYFGSDSGTVKELKGAIGYGGGIRYGLTSNLIIGAGYTKISGSGQVNWDDGSSKTGEAKYPLSVGGFTGSVLFAMGSESSNFYCGGGAGLYSATITRTMSSDPEWVLSGIVSEIVYQGKSTFGFHGVVGGEYFLSNNIAFGVEAMYRLVTFPGEWTIKECPDNPSLEGTLSAVWTEPVQTGGITIRAGFRFYVG